MARNDEMAELKKIVNLVQDYVEKYKYAYIIPEHVLIVLLEDEKCKRMINKITSDTSKELTISDIKSAVEKYIEANVDKVKTTSAISPTMAYTKIIQNSITQAAMRSLEPDSLNIFSSLFLDKDQSCAFFLGKHGIYEENVQEYIREHRRDDNDFLDDNLSEYAVELVSIAKKGKIDPLIGREKEIERVVQVLAKKRSCNPIFVGESGTGKSAIVEGLALRIAEGKVPDSLKDKLLYAIDLTGMVAGAKYRGEFEKRLQDTIKEAIKNPNIILFIDELHTVCGAGSAEGTMDASNILKPYLSRGELRCIGATTYDEYKNSILKNKAFARRFKKIDVCEPNKEETLGILKGLKTRYEEFHGVSFPDDVLQYIVKLSGQYIFDKFFPDKAIDVMDEIGARYHSQIQTGDTATKIDVETVICSMANISKITVEMDDCEKLRSLGDRIKENLYGQNEIVDKIVRQVRMSKAGLASADRPLVFMGVGQSGCGKTELAKQVASSLGIGFVKLDMSEYSEEYSTSRLIGSAAGYVGYEQAGALTEPLIKNPHCVVLLDEIEKANKTVFDLLLQVMDEGRLTDNHGREASFRNAIVIMTSNVGCSDADKISKPLGFGSSDKAYSEKKGKALEDAFKSKFSPEFRNRITDVFYFNPLGEESLGLIVDKNIRRINNALKEKETTVEITPNAKQWFIKKSMEENAGGRPVERIINSNVSEKIADEILFGRLSKGGKAVVDEVKNEIVLKISKKK